MKSIITIAAALLLTASLFAQNGRAIYEKYSDHEDVSAVYISPSMFRMMGKVPEISTGEGDVDISPAIRALKGMYVISSENASINGQLRDDVLAFVKAGKYELMMEAKEEGELVHIYTMNEGENITGLVILASEERECSFICLEGKMKMDEFEALLGAAMQ